MKPHSRTHAIAIWLASLAILISGFLPPMAHADTRGGPMAEVCSASGKVWASDGLGEASKSRPSSEGQSGHCPVCTLDHPTVSLPPVWHMEVPLALASTEAPALFLVAPYTLYVWTAAQPRAPPLA